jgi:putative ABC transport system permease protein
MSATPRPSQLRLRDLLWTSAMGLRSRRLRAILSALGIAIGIAAIVGVLGIAQSSEANLLSQIDQLGTNFVTAADAGAASGQTSTLPPYAPAMIRRASGVQQVATTATLPAASVYRSDRVPSIETAGLSVVATDLSLLGATRGTMLEGDFLNPATERYPVTVLGSVAASTLGISQVRPSTRVWIGGQWFAVAGIIRPLPLAPELNRAAIVGLPVATALLGYDSHPTKIYVRTAIASTSRVASVLAESAFPEDPADVVVNQPSAALTARAAIAQSSTGLFVALGAVALLVGGIGIANVMIIAVLERRGEIGIRRTLGASQQHIRRQFLTEAILLCLAGGLLGVLAGALLTAAMALARGWQLVLSAQAIGGGLATAIAVGAIAGVIPAIRAARLSPTQALRT